MTPVQADQSNAVLRDNLRCPYIGLAYDVNTLSEYPSNLNYCHRSQPSTRILPDLTLFRMPDVVNHKIQQTPSRNSDGKQPIHQD